MFTMDVKQQCNNNFAYKFGASADILEVFLPTFENYKIYNRISSTDLTSQIRNILMTKVVNRLVVLGLTAL